MVRRVIVLQYGAAALGEVARPGSSFAASPGRVGGNLQGLRPIPALVALCMCARYSMGGIPAHLGARAYARNSPFCCAGAWCFGALAL